MTLEPQAPQPTVDPLYNRAEHAADAKLKFYASAASTLCLIAIVMAFDWWTTGGITWSIWPVFGLGFALASQGVNAWFRTGSLRDQLIARELDILRRHRR